MATFFDKQSGKAERTAEQIEHKKQLLAEKVKQMNAICKELVEAGVLELSENELDKVNGGLPLFGPLSDSDRIDLSYQRLFTPDGQFTEFWYHLVDGTTMDLWK